MASRACSNWAWKLCVSPWTRRTTRTLVFRFRGSIRFPTNSTRGTTACSSRHGVAFCWPTTQAPAKRLWLACC